MSEYLICPGFICAFCTLVMGIISMAMIASSGALNMYRVSDLANAHFQMTKEWKTDFIYDIYVVE